MPRRRPSYPDVMSTVAVFIALGGGAYAASELSKNSVRSKHIKNGQVKRADVRKGAINSSRVKDGSLQAHDFGAGALPAGPKGDTGERGATGEPGATGEQGPAGPGARQFSFRAPHTTDTSPTEILSFHGLVIEAACVGGELALQAQTTSADAVIAGAFADNFGESSPIRDGDFDPGAEEPLVFENDEEGGGSFAYQPASGPVVSVVYGFYEESGAGGNVCWAAGTATPGD